MCELLTIWEKHFSIGINIRNFSFLTDMHLLFVATGIYDSVYLKSVEIINPDPSNQNLICDPIPDFPVGFYAGTGQLLNVTVILFKSLWHSFTIKNEHLCRLADSSDGRAGDCGSKYCKDILLNCVNIILS